MCFDVFRRWSGKLGFLTCKKHSVFEVFVMLRVKNPSVFEVFTNYFLGGSQGSILRQFSSLVVCYFAFLLFVW